MYDDLAARFSAPDHPRQAFGPRPDLLPVNQGRVTVEQLDTGAEGNLQLAQSLVLLRGRNFQHVEPVDRLPILGQRRDAGVAEADRLGLAGVDAVNRRQQGERGADTVRRRVRVALVGPALGYTNTLDRLGASHPTFSFYSVLVCPGITPFLPNIQNWTHL
ncbi:hypothetical protein HMPREF9694_05578 [Klebsiella michiganensis]|nr:hypothetical protein HMPREF9694_05578 [Klebsiella michiganensis]